MATRDDVKSVLKMFLFAGLKSNAITLESIGDSVDAFHAVLDDIAPDALMSASKQYLSTATWFPTPGQIRQEAVDLQLLAMGVPTPNEAWAQVLGAVRYKPGQECETGARLNAVIHEEPHKYWARLMQHDAHVKGCSVCTSGGMVEEYAHPAVKKTVEMLGGRQRLLTDNQAADRARFIEAYRDIVTRETKLATMPADVRGYVEKTKTFMVSGEMKKLAEGMKA